MPLITLTAVVASVFFAVYLVTVRAARHRRLGLVVAVSGAAIVALLAWAVVDASGLRRLDDRVAEWAHAHATHTTTEVLLHITRIGAPGSVLVLVGVFAVLATLWTRSLWVVAFVACVVGGNALLTTVIKELADRVRPAIDPLAATLGPSFPSGHSSYTAAACAAAAMVLASRAGRRTRATLAGTAAACAVLIAGTRVLLDVHWLSDVVAGLALGWAWFALCAIAFGRRLRFATPRSLRWRGPSAAQRAR
jgi:undecaprenyl-diphosphatase